MEVLKDRHNEYTFVMMDMNHLKHVNDEMGHVMGDTYIKTLAKYIEESFTGEDRCFRMGGDEFFVMTKNKASKNAFQNSLIALNERIVKYNEENKVKIPMSVAVGYAEYKPGKEEPEDVIKLADERMYAQKKTMHMEFKGAGHRQE